MILYRKAQQGDKIVLPTVLDSIYNEYPGLRKMGDTEVKADTSFTSEKTGIGDIEYFSPMQDSVRYNNYTYGHPSFGKHGVVYNPKTNNQESVMLDMLHGMTEVPEYNKLREEFKKLAMEDRGGDIKYFYKQDRENGYAGDGYERWVNNYVDGLIRSEISTAVDDGDYSEERKGNSKRMKAKADEIRAFLKDK